MLTPTTREILTFNHPSCLREYCQPATSGRDRRRTDRATSFPLCRRVSIQICRTVHWRCQVEMVTVDASHLGNTLSSGGNISYREYVVQSQTRPVAARTASENGNAFRQFAAMLR
jgi:hypothetical protein